MQMRGDVGRRVLEADVLRSGTMELPVVTDPS
jgi:hypothetical protein